MPNLPTLQSRWLILAAWLSALAVLFLQLGSFPLTDVDEGAFSEATREMLARGDWVSPWLLDQPRFDKPALTHWAQMLGIQVAGLTPYGVRLPSALAGLLWIGGIGGWAYLIARRLKGVEPLEAYGWGVMIAGTTLAIPAMSRAATADALLNAMLVGSLVLIWMGLTAEQRPRLWSRLAAVVIGIGLLTKGPVALVIPGLAVLISALVCGQVRRLLHLAADPIAWLLLIAVSLPWYLLQLQAQGMPFIEGFFGTHNLERMATPLHGFSAGLLYTPLTMAAAILPWTPMFIVLLLRPHLLLGSEQRLPWMVALVVLGLFSLTATKLPHYGIYGIGGLVAILAIGLARARLAGRWLAGWVAIFTTGLMLIALGLMPFWFSILLSQVDNPTILAALEEASEGLIDIQLPMLGFLALGVVGVLFARVASGGLLILMPAALALGLHSVVVPIVASAYRAPIVALGGDIREGRLEGPADYPLVAWRMQSPSLSFVAQQIVPTGEPAAGRRVVMQTQHLVDLPEGLRAEPIWGPVGGVLVVRVEADARRAGEPDTRGASEPAKPEGPEASGVSEPVKPEGPEGPEGPAARGASKPAGPEASGASEPEGPEGPEASGASELVKPAGPEPSGASKPAGPEASGASELVKPDAQSITPL